MFNRSKRTKPRGRLLAPGVPLGLNRFDQGMQVPGVDRGLYQHILSGRELLTQVGVLTRDGDEQGGHVIAYWRLLQSQTTALAVLKLGGNNICSERDCAGEGAPGIMGQSPCCSAGARLVTGR